MERNGPSVGIWRRIPWIKLTVVVAIVWFASTRLDLGDRLVVAETPAPEGSRATASPAPPSPASVRFILSSGEAITLVEGDSLPVRVVTGEGGRSEAWAMTSSGRGRVDADLIAPHGPLEIRPGLRSSLRGISLPRLVLALLVYAPIPLLLAWRWHVLLRAAGVRIGGATTLRLTWIGLFFNTVIPGGTGGDLVKLVEVGRHTPHRSTVLSTILVDRVAGLLALIALGLVAAATAGGGSTGIVSTGVVVGGCLAVGFAVYTSAGVRRLADSSRVRRFVDVRALLARLPLRDELIRLDEAILAMRAAPLALIAVVAVSFVTHGLAIAVALQVARALGLVAVTLLDMLRIVPIAFVANAIPLSPGGLGQLEVAFQELMHRQGLSSLAQGFMVGVLVRATSVVWSLPGLPLWMTTVRRRPDGVAGDVEGANDASSSEVSRVIADRTR